MGKTSDVSQWGKPHEDGYFTLEDSGKGQNICLRLEIDSLTGSVNKANLKVLDIVNGRPAAKSTSFDLVKPNHFVDITMYREKDDINLPLRFNIIQYKTNYSALTNLARLDLSVGNQPDPDNPGQWKNNKTDFKLSRLLGNTELPSGKSCGIIGTTDSRNFQGGPLVNAVSGSLSWKPYIQPVPQPILREKVRLKVDGNYLYLTSDFDVFEFPDNQAGRLGLNLNEINVPKWGCNLNFQYI